MPTARELLEQADALMRRNRASAGGDVPVLTDSVSGTLESAFGPATRGPASALRMPAPHDRSGDAGVRLPGSEALARSLDRSVVESVEPPVLTDAVEEVAVDVVPLPPASTDDDAAPWLGPDTIDPALHSITGPSPDTTAHVPPVTMRTPPAFEKRRESEATAPDPIAAPTLRAAGSAPTPAPAGSMPHAMPAMADEPMLLEPMPVEAMPAEPAASVATHANGTPEAPAHVEPAHVDPAHVEPAHIEPEPAVPAPVEPVAIAPMPMAEVMDDDRWRALAEQISMQVLQRLDLFVDTGLKTRLAAHLQPIVERAGTELVEAINEHVGQLVRSYVAEAIEREIAQWRQDQR
jgi:hypothetical protein